MKFFSKLVFICNLCFISGILFRYVDVSASAGGGEVARVQAFLGVILVLYFLSVFLNLLFVIITIFHFFIKKKSLAPQWLTAVNIVFLPLQLVYFFLS